MAKLKMENGKSGELPGVTMIRLNQLRILYLYFSLYYIFHITNFSSCPKVCMKEFAIYASAISCSTSIFANTFGDS